MSTSTPLKKLKPNDYEESIATTDSSTVNMTLINNQKQKSLLIFFEKTNNNHLKRNYDQISPASIELLTEKNSLNIKTSDKIEINQIRNVETKKDLIEKDEDHENEDQVDILTKQDINEKNEIIYESKNEKKVSSKNKGNFDQNPEERKSSEKTNTSDCEESKSKCNKDSIKESKSKKSNSKKKTKVYYTSTILTNPEFNTIFELDKNDKTKVFCKYCKSTYIPNSKDLRKHIGSTKHIESVNDYDKNNETITKFAVENKSIRADIIWSYFTAMRNLSFLLTDHAKTILPHMFCDSEIAKSMVINRLKTKKIIETVLTFALRKKKIPKMKKLFSLMLDFSRDISNKNEFMIATCYFDEESAKIMRTVYITVEQNKISGEESLKKLKEELNIDSIKLESCLSIMSDNASDMIGEIGIVSRIKGENNSIYSLTCICHRLNLILKHLSKHISSHQEDLMEGSEDILTFVNSIAAFFNVSCRRQEDYKMFSNEFLKNAHDVEESIQINEAYSEPKAFLQFPKFSHYAETRFLSMTESLKKLIMQWECLLKFFEDYLERKDDLKLKKEVVNKIQSYLNHLKNDKFKFIVYFIYWISEELNTQNIFFQSNESRIHEIFSKSMYLYDLFATMILKEDIISNLRCNQMKFHNFDYFTEEYHNSRKDFEQFIHNYIDYDRPIPNGYFTIAKENLNNETFDFARRTIQELLQLFCKYLPVDDEIIQSLQLLDIRKRKEIKDDVALFRTNLLKRFPRAYDIKDYELILKEYRKLSQKEDKNLPLKPSKYIDNDNNFRPEPYWIDMYLNNQKNDTGKLARFFINILLIPHSNCFVERMYSFMNIIKTPIRNSLDINTVSSILQIKSYYEEQELFEPDEDHYFFYKHNIHDI